MAYSCDTFARGAIRATQWLVHQKSGPARCRLRWSLSSQEHMKAKSIFVASSFLTLALIIAGCGAGVQRAYWSANTSVGLEAEKKGDLERAEIELRLALNRARRYLTPEDVSNSLYNLGQFHGRQQRLDEAIYHLSESLKLEETLSGPDSERTGRRIAELMAAYLLDGKYNEGRPLAQRLHSLASKYTGSERVFVDTLLEEYRKKPEEYAREMQRLRPLVSKGDPAAQYQLAAFYEDGRGVQQDHKKALELYILSANQGYLEAQYYVGVIHDKGRGVSPNDEEARKWYRVAAERGHKIAQYNYAVMLVKGRGGPEDKNAAVEWLRKSSAQGYPPAKHALKILLAR